MIGKFAAQRAQNEKMILDTDGTKRSSLELVNTLPNGKIQTEWAMLNIPLHILKNQMGHSKVSTTI